MENSQLKEYMKVIAEYGDDRDKIVEYLEAIGPEVSSKVLSFAGTEENKPLYAQGGGNILRQINSSDGNLFHVEEVVENNEEFEASSPRTFDLKEENKTGFYSIFKQNIKPIMKYGLTGVGFLTLLGAIYSKDGGVNQKYVESTISKKIVPITEKFNGLERKVDTIGGGVVTNSKNIGVIANILSEDKSGIYEDNATAKISVENDTVHITYFKDKDLVTVSHGIPVNCDSFIKSDKFNLLNGLDKLLNDNNRYNIGKILNKVSNKKDYMIHDEKNNECIFPIGTGTLVEYAEDIMSKKNKKLGLSYNDLPQALFIAKQLKAKNNITLSNKLDIFAHKYAVVPKK